MIAFTIPGLRLKSLNSREHWRVKAKRVKAERNMAGCHTRLAIIRASNPMRKPEFTTQPFPEPPMVITITRIGHRLMDSDNAVGACKHVRDQIAEDLSIDDGDPRVTWIVEQEKGPYGVRVRIETDAERVKALYHSEAHIRASMQDGPRLRLHIGPPPGSKIG